MWSNKWVLNFSIFGLLVVGYWFLFAGLLFLTPDFQLRSSVFHLLIPFHQFFAGVPKQFFEIFYLVFFYNCTLAFK